MHNYAWLCPAINMQLYIAMYGYVLYAVMYGYARLCAGFYG